MGTKDDSTALDEFGRFLHGLERNMYKVRKESIEKNGGF